MYEPKVRLLESHGSQKGRLTTWKKAHPVTSMQFVPRLMPASHDRSRTDGLTCLPRLARPLLRSDRFSRIRVVGFKMDFFTAAMD